MNAKAIGFLDEFIYICPAIWVKAQTNFAGVMAQNEAEKFADANKSSIHITLFPK